MAPLLFHNVSLNWAVAAFSGHLYTGCELRTCDTAMAHAEARVCPSGTYRSTRRKTCKSPDEAGSDSSLPFATHWRAANCRASTGMEPYP